MEEFDIMDDYIERVKELNIQIDKFRPFTSACEMKKEIERLNNIINKKEQFLGDNIKRLEREVVKRDNIINELEKELKNNYSVWMCKARGNGKSVQFGIDVCKTHFYNRLQELKGDSSNGNK